MFSTNFLANPEQKSKKSLKCNLYTGEETLNMKQPLQRLTYKWIKLYFLYAAHKLINYSN